MSDENSADETTERTRLVSGRTDNRAYQWGMDTETSPQNQQSDMPSRPEPDTQLSDRVRIPCVY